MRKWVLVRLSNLSKVTQKESSTAPFWRLSDSKAWAFINVSHLSVFLKVLGTYRLSPLELLGTWKCILLVVYILWVYIIEIWEILHSATTSQWEHKITLALGVIFKTVTIREASTKHYMAAINNYIRKRISGKLSLRFHDKKIT